MNNNHVVVVSANDNIEKVYLCNNREGAVSKMKSIVNDFQNGKYKQDFESLEVVNENKVIIKTAYKWYVVSVKLVEIIPA